MFDWSSYAKLAKSLEKYTKRSTIPEAYFRSAVSRAYYSSFHITEEYAKAKLSYIPPRRSAHSALIIFLKRKTDPTLILLGQELEACRNNRTTCDYIASKNINSSYVQSVFIKTDYINNTVKSLY